MDQLQALLEAFKSRYPGVYLACQHQVRLNVHDGTIVHEWTLWHAKAGQHVGPYPTATLLADGVSLWEATGERSLAEQHQAAKGKSDSSLAGLTEAREKSQRRLCEHYRRMNEPGYIPTVEEAARDPDAFVAGMTEARCEHHELPPALGPGRIETT